VGLCGSDTDGCAAMVNSAQARILFARETSNTGFWGAWSEMAFNITQTDPFITLPRGGARIISLDACTRPVPIQNQFYEYLDFGVGHYPKTTCAAFTCTPFQGLSRGMVPTLTDITPGNKVRVYPSSTADEGLRTLITGKDTNDSPVSNLDGTVVVNGEMVAFETPFADTLTGWNSITAIQKDRTIGPVSYYEVDPVTSVQSLLITMEPSETVASYRRYYFSGVPSNCCNGAEEGTVQVTALVKLDLIPCKVDTDYLLVQNLEALIAECQSVRFSEMDSPGAMIKSEERHRAAIRLINGELAHFEGKDQPVISFDPFGSAHLRNQRIGSLN